MIFAVIHFSMRPESFLLVLLALMAAAFSVHRVSRSRRRRSLRRLAQQRRMQYAERDLFHLADRICAAWPIADCTDVSVHDVLYGSAFGLHRYVFTVHFTLGPLDNFRRSARVATFAEPTEDHKNRGHHSIKSQDSPGQLDKEPLVPLTIADNTGNLVEQYARLFGG